MGYIARMCIQSHFYVKAIIATTRGFPAEFGNIWMFPSSVGKPREVANGQGLSKINAFSPEIFYHRILYNHIQLSFLVKKYANYERKFTYGCMSFTFSWHWPCGSWDDYFLKGLHHIFRCMNCHVWLMLWIKFSCNWSSPYGDFRYFVY